MSTTVCSSIREIPPGYFLADCATSGGTLQVFLRKALEASGGKLCLRIAPVYMDFPLPCPSGTGRVLSLSELQTLHQGQPCYFSRALCTEYFTLLQDGQAHAVLFDSLRSLRAKYDAAVSCGIPLVLLEDAALRRKITEKSTP